MTIPEPAFRARWAAVLAVAGGGCGVLAFPPFGLWPLAFVSVAALSIAVHGRRSRRAAWLGLLYGIAFFAPLLHWSGVYVGPAPWLILAVTEAAYLAALGAILPLLQRLPGSPVWVGCGWVLAEFVRGRWPFGGFPWGRWAFSQASSPLRWFAAVGGAPLVSFAVALAGGGLAAGWLALGSTASQRHGSGRRVVDRRAVNRRCAAGVAVAVAVPLAGLLASWPLTPPPDSDSRIATIALVQGNVPQAGLQIETRRRQVLDNHVAQTLALAARIRSGAVAHPDLVVWPENSSDIDPFTNADAGAEISAAADAVDAPILVGAILDGPGDDHVRNAGVLWLPHTGAAAMYVKRHPVPFAEYIPLRGLAKIVSDKVDLVQRDMVAGKGNGIITDAGFTIGDVICFEVAYDGLVHSSAAAGAQLLVVQTNNATFGYTAEAPQQLAMSQLRAVEHGRAVVEVSTTGITAAIGPDGRIRQRSGALYTPDVIIAALPLRSTATLATRLGAGPEYGLAAAALVCCGWSYLRRRRAAGQDPEDSGRTEEMVHT